jgi:ribonucleoside-diphosphate reductase alpha chain
MSVTHQPDSVNLQVIKRNGERVPYDRSRIRVAINKAFIATAKDPNLAHSDTECAELLQRSHKKANRLSLDITAHLKQLFPYGGTIDIEKIQNIVQSHLMDAGEHNVASRYIIYREERRKARKQPNAPKAQPIATIHVKQIDGTKTPFTSEMLRKTIQTHCQDLPNTDPNIVFQQAWQNLYEGIPVDEITQALVMGTSHLTEQDPNYSNLTARFLLDQFYKEACDFLQCDHITTLDDYSNYFQAYIKKGIELELLDPELQSFDLNALGSILHRERDRHFTYLSLRTLYDRYCVHHKKIRLELPQAFFMRVAMGLALKEDHKTEKAIEFYSVLSSFDYMVSTPTLFNAGTLRPQLSSCFLTTIPDDLEGIYDAGIKVNALLSKFAGGLGNDWTPVRAMGAVIKGTNGISQGVVPFMNVANASAVAVNQGGKRKGAVCAYLETWHLDIEEFLELRKNTGDDRRRTHDMNTANWVPDLFMKRRMEEGNWTLFSPDEVPDLHETYGLEFEKRYQAYEAKAARGEIANYKQLPALTLWRKMLNLLYETGHPWLTFKDACNLRSPQSHCGVIHSSNLCTEITLNTSAHEIAVCNLGSINLAQHLTENGEWDTVKLKHTIRTAMRMLDNVIDINYYTVPQAKNSNLKHRPVGLGVMGFQDVLYKKKIAFDDPRMLTLSDQILEIISYYAIEASSDLAKERGSYESFQGSLWSQGILPIDSIERLQETRGPYLIQNREMTLDWALLRTKVKQQGMRNSNCLAIAPTATISNICNVTPSIEPIYQNLFVKSNMSGEFTVINPYLVQDLKELGLWDNIMIQDLKYYDGSVQLIDRIPDSLKKLYATAFEVDPLQLIEAASRRQKWLDQSQSLNLFMAEPSGKKLDKIYKEAWLRGLKTTYYLRTKGKSHLEKATTTRGVLNAVSLESKQTATTSPTVGSTCQIDDESCEVCQ